MISSPLKALFPPRLWICVHFCREVYILKILIWKLYCFYNIRLECMPTCEEKWLKKGVWTHLFLTATTTTCILKLWHWNCIVCQQKVDGGLQSPHVGEGKPEGWAQDIIQLFSEPAAQAAYPFCNKMVVPLGTYCHLLLVSHSQYFPSTYLRIVWHMSCGYQPN